MSSLLDTLKEAKGNSVVAYTEFILKYSKDNGQMIHCFFEGNDDFKYYQSRIEGNAPAFRIMDYICQGKDKVIGVYTLIKNQEAYRNARTAFFIDKDFDPQNTNNDFYETPYHSVENFYTDSDTIRKILRIDFNIRDEDDIESCLRVFDRLFNEFNLKVLNVNSWLACYADKRNNGMAMGRLNINNAVKDVITKVVLPDLSSIIPLEEVQTKEGIDALFNNNDITEEEYSIKVNHFSQVDMPKVFRGKIAIKFLVNFLDRFKTQIGNRDQTICKKHYSCKLRFEDSTIMTQLNSYALTTECLRVYIQRIAA
ncbi:MAG: DUF4435 domain-containing protein [Bacteroidetes bacterium]|nr:DUF4435 domain-containing protein [Bacteroidota bacterium]